ncbi:MAG: carboxypeptidase-like regulatory domain-containing protein [Terriglobia bacterium]
MEGRREVSVASVVVLAAALLFSGLAAGAQQESTRAIRGQVLDSQGKTVRRAIVYLVNENTKDKWSVVTDKKGRYQFNDLKMNEDYKLYGEWRDQQSRTRSISQFDTRTEIFINLRLQPKKEQDKEEKKSDEEEEKEEKEPKD